MLAAMSCPVAAMMGRQPTPLADGLPPFRSTGHKRVGSIEVLSVFVPGAARAEYMLARRVLDALAFRRQSDSSSMRTADVSTVSREARRGSALDAPHLATMVEIGSGPGPWPLRIDDGCSQSPVARIVLERLLADAMGPSWASETERRAHLDHAAYALATKRVTCAAELVGLELLPVQAAKLADVFSRPGEPLLPGVKRRARAVPDGPSPFHDGELLGSLIIGYTITTVDGRGLALCPAPADCVPANDFVLRVPVLAEHVRAERPHMPASADTVATLTTNGAEAGAMLRWTGSAFGGDSIQGQASAPSLAPTVAGLGGWTAHASLLHGVPHPGVACGLVHQRMQLASSATALQAVLADMGAGDRVTPSWLAGFLARPLEERMRLIAQADEAMRRAQERMLSLHQLCDAWASMLLTGPLVADDDDPAKPDGGSSGDPGSTSAHAGTMAEGKEGSDSDDGHGATTVGRSGRACCDPLSGLFWEGLARLLCPQLRSEAD